MSININYHQFESKNTGMTLTKCTLSVSQQWYFRLTLRLIWLCLHSKAKGTLLFVLIIKCPGPDSLHFHACQDKTDTGSRPTFLGTWPLWPDGRKCLDNIHKGMRTPMHPHTYSHNAELWMMTEMHLAPCKHRLPCTQTGGLRTIFSHTRTHTHTSLCEP